jgi:hypothetical protein
VSNKDETGKDLGGYSGSIFTYAVPEGQHGFALPGEQTDQAIAQCEQSGGTDCQTLVGQKVDVGWYMFHVFGRFLKHGAQQHPLSPDACNTRQACNDIPEPPPQRPAGELP